MKFAAFVLWQLSLFAFGEEYIVDPGPQYKATKGEVWPKPNSQVKHDTYFIVRPQLFRFKANDSSGCFVLREALIRYSNIINDHYGIIAENLETVDHEFHKKTWLADKNYLGSLSSLDITFSEPCNDKEYPKLNMDEKYQLNITKEAAVLKAATIWGILRGLETFSQLLYIGNEQLSLRINTTSIVDYPRFTHRGLLLDTSRHFIPVRKILTTLDAMAYNKFNVFHWHIVDDQSFPYVSVKYPELSDKGAYYRKQIYSVDEVQQIIHYARLRGIRVMPEFDTPGHTRSWGVAHPEILTACEGNFTGKLGPIDPSKEIVYDFLEGLFEEIHETFPEEYVHLGGDEVGFECWKSNSNITKFMAKNNIFDYFSLESYYVQKVINMVEKLGSKSVVWEEVFSNGVKLPSDTIVHVWLNSSTVSEVISSGKPALLSACWYLDDLDMGGDWQKYYSCEPNNFARNGTQRKLLLGGEACMWAEAVNEHNVISRVWPRASATAEKLWSNENITTVDEATLRLEEHACRMNRRRIEAQPPNGPGFCLGRGEF
ncbi:beta-hexosaminidase subunit beta [Leptinotarsa decemlineata]|uniref:beta-hexosaminidase subunit beta n=1 Tax=Leptinotarsa decemlineata TaxID=7539 RepID=UPI003D306175